MSDTKPKAFIFVLMPFSDDFTDIYQAGIKPACIDAGAYCERVDEQIFHDSILERIYNQINKADLVVADMTGRNPNVFYETGYAHALGKKVILLTQHDHDIPFDLKHYPHIVYSGRIVELKEALGRRVAWYLSQSNQTRIDENAIDQISFYISGKELKANTTLDLPIKDVNWYSDSVSIWSTVSLHNPTQYPINPAFHVGFVFPEFTTFHEYTSVRDTRLPDGRILTETRDVQSEIGPFCWLSVSFHAQFDRSDVPVNLCVPVIMRVFQATGVQDISFNVMLPKPNKIKQ